MLCRKLPRSVSFQNPIVSPLGEKQESVSTAGQEQKKGGKKEREVHTARTLATEVQLVSKE